MLRRLFVIAGGVEPAVVAACLMQIGFMAGVWCLIELQEIQRSWFGRFTVCVLDGLWEAVEFEDFWIGPRVT